MAEVVFTVGKSVETRETEITVAGGLQPGTYTFQLVVEDDSGNKSTAASVNVSITTPGRIPPTTEGTTRPTIRDTILSGRLGDRIVNR